MGGDLGFSNPIGDQDFDANLMVQGYFEYLQSPELSWRGMLALYTFDGPRVPPFGESNDVDVLAILGNLIYRWDAGSVHPFLTGGLGLYNYDPDLGDGSLELGLNVGGGAEFDLNPTVGIKLEGGFHGTSGPEPDTLFVATVGVRFRL